MALKKVGVRITIPKSWAVVDLTREKRDELVRTAEKGPNKAAARYIRRHAGTFTKNLLLYACKPRGDTCFDNLVVTLIPATPGSPIGHEEQIKAGYEATGVLRNVTVSDTVVDGTPAVQVLSEASSVAGPPRILHGTGYVVPGKKDAVAIDFTTDDDGLQNADVQNMLHSIKLPVSAKGRT